MSAAVEPGRDESDPGPRVEVAHEALIRHWPRLRGWLAEDRGSLRLRQELGQAAQEWARHGREEIWLEHRGGRLAAAEELAGRAGFLNAAERAYVAACVGLRERGQRRARIGWFAAVGVSLAVAALFLVLWLRASQAEDRAVTSQKTAQANADAAATSEAAAEAQANMARARSLAVQAAGQRQLPGDDELSALLARQAYLFGEAGGGSVLDQVDPVLRAALDVDHFGRVLRGHEGTVSAVAFDATMPLLASGGDDGTVRLWDLARPGAPTEIFNGPKEGISAVALSRDGRRLAARGGDGVVRVWEAGQSAAPPVLIRDPGDHRAAPVAFSPDGRRVATGGADGTVRLWDPAQPESPPALLHGPAPSIYSVAFSPDGRHLAAGGCSEGMLYRCADGTVQLWDLDRPEATPVVLRSHQGGPTPVAFSRDGGMLAAAGCAQRLDDQARGESYCPHSQIWLWDPTRTDTPPTVLLAHESWIDSLALSPDGRALAADGADNTVRLWNLTRPEDQPVVLGGHLDFVFSVAFRADGRTIASGSRDGTIRLWDLAPPAAPAVVRGPGNPISSVVIGADGRVFSASHAGGVEVWDPTRPEGSPLPRGDSEGGIYALDVSPDGRRLAGAGGLDGTVWTWDLTHPDRAPAAFQIHEGAVWTVAFSRDGRFLAAAGCTERHGPVDCTLGEVRVWDVERPEAVPIVLLGHETNIDSIAFGADDQMLASRTGATILLWDLTRPEAAIAGFAGPEGAGAVAFSADGQRLAAAGDADGTVRMWSLDRRAAPPLVFSDRAGAATWVTFSPGGRTLAVGGADGSVRLWDPDRPGAHPIVLAGGDGSITTVAFSPDGRTLAAGDDTRSVRVWIAQTESLAETVCEVVWRNLTLAEWEWFVGSDTPYQSTCPNLPPGAVGGPVATPEAGRLAASGAASPAPSPTAEVDGDTP